MSSAGSPRELLGMDVSGGCARCFGTSSRTVRIALAAALHHSAGPKEKVEMQQIGAPRGQKTAARAREVEEQATHDGLRAQTAPPPGVRPGRLAEPGPQRSDRSLRRSSGHTPLLGVPSLADAPAEAINGRTLRYLLKANLARKKYEEEEEKKYQEKAAETKRRAQALLDHAKKKGRGRRGRKNFLVAALDADNGSVLFLVRSSSTPAEASSFWCAHRRLRQRHVQAWFSFLVLCSLWLQTGPDARHHGRYDQEDTYAPRIW